MPERTTITRLSVLAFDDLGGLCRALGELLSHGIGTDQLGFIGRPPILDRLAAFVGTPETVRRLLSADRQLASLPTLSSARDGLCEHCGSDLARALSGTGLEAGKFSWMDEVLGQRLADEAEQGALVLLASATSAPQHTLVGRVLLRHGRHDLQTHEFSRPTVSRRDA